MKVLATRLTIILFALSCAATANAETGDWYVAPSVAYVDDDPDRAVADAVAGLQVNVGRDITERLSFEGLLGYTNWDGFVDPGESYPDQNVIDLSANLLAFLDRDKEFAPYFLVGIGYLGADLESAGSDNRLSGTLGVGFKWRMGQSNYSIRSEARVRLVFDSDARWTGSGNLTDNIVSLGVQYNFGRKTSTPVPAAIPRGDTDGDGVNDARDRCPNTPQGVQVDIVGCGDDSDGDRVRDHADQCPYTPRGTPVDPFGCAFDSDRDGVTTDKDRCPATPPGAAVDIYGCSLDRDDDSDGVTNQFDKCRDTAPGVRVDSTGCEFTDVIRLPGVNFETNSDLLLAGIESRLEGAAATLNRYPDLQIEVAGHTDSDGSGLANFSLSERRAKTVRDYLIQFGVDADRLTATGYGESQPIADNTSANGKAANRRVELRIVNR